MNVSIVLTGPIGASGGRIDVKGYALSIAYSATCLQLRILSVHAGLSSGVIPKLWPAYDTPAYEALLKSLIGFAKARFCKYFVVSAKVRY